MESIIKEFRTYAERVRDEINEKSDAPKDMNERMQIGNKKGMEFTARVLPRIDELVADMSPNEHTKARNALTDVFAEINMELLRG